DGGDDGRMDAVIERAKRVTSGRFHDVDESTYASEGLRDPLEFADRHRELLSHRRMRGDCAKNEFSASRALSPKRDATAGGKRLHQHVPTSTGALFTADDRIDRDHDVFALSGRVVERDPQRIVPAICSDARGFRGDQSAGDAQILALAQEILGIFELKR